MKITEIKWVSIHAYVNFDDNRVSRSAEGGLTDPVGDHHFPSFEIEGVTYIMLCLYFPKDMHKLTELTINEDDFEQYKHLRHMTYFTAFTKRSDYSCIAETDLLVRAGKLV